ncbi:MAG TPA: hypothetical protein VIQ60_08180 [Gemmatimonadaceae bacterium]
MSDSERPDIAAFRELEQLIRSLGDEMSAWRRRAHEAESRLKEAEARIARETELSRSASEAPTPAPPMPEPTPPQPAVDESALKRENEELRQRLGAARVRTKQLVDRMRFLRQQHEVGGTER